MRLLVARCGLLLGPGRENGPRVALGEAGDTLEPDELVTPQPGGFCGGWIMSAVVGPFKREPGTWGW